MRFKHFSSLPQYMEHNISEGVIFWALTTGIYPALSNWILWNITWNYNTDDFGLTYKPQNGRAGLNNKHPSRGRHSDSCPSKSTAVITRSRILLFTLSGVPTDSKVGDTPNTTRNISDKVIRYFGFFLFYLTSLASKGRTVNINWKDWGSKWWRLISVLPRHVLR